MGEQDERKRVKFVFDLYAGDNKVDACDVMNAVRGLNLNPTIALVNKTVGTEKRGEKYYNFDEFYNIYEELRDNKEQGGFVDFVECLKIYDVGENGLMKLVDLTSMLLALGEKVTQNELDEVLEDCQLEEEDDDGWFPYLPFLCRLCEQPIPKSWKPAL